MILDRVINLLMGSRFSPVQESLLLILFTFTLVYFPAFEKTILNIFKKEWKTVSVLQWLGIIPYMLLLLFCIILIIIAQLSIISMAIY